ncbi:hypothetical protein PGB34_02615 [Xenophilus arseniciresistens]|uniref:Uncharacterized protein n=1 Tax=Xenophilus arseniciresistens TaxID=1283306 RepID=A0AAE3SXM3_9BURK|nr:hypothetical protein [Xenophilus arseniciresistens]MDA7415247.1 hypothetical protein [Xenophilus arseniciresistens]
MSDLSSAQEALLGQVEQQLAVVDRCLLADDPDALDRAAAELRQLSVGFAQALGAQLSAASLSPALRSRIEAVGQRLDLQRESLARRSVRVDRALASLMGPAVSVTYSMPGRSSSFGVH